MSRVKLVDFKDKLPSVSEWSKMFRYRSSSPRITLGSPSVAGDYAVLMFERFLLTCANSNRDPGNESTQY